MAESNYHQPYDHCYLCQNLLKMKYFFTTVLIVFVLLMACQSETKDKPGKTVPPEKQGDAVVTTSTDDQEAIITFQPKTGDLKPMEVNMSEATVTNGNDTDLTPEEKEKILEKRRAKTAFNNGLQYYREENMTEAIKSFIQVLELDPNNDKAYFNLGKIYAMQNQPDLALSYYEDAIRYNPSDSGSLVGVGMIYFKRGDLAKAMDYYNRAIQVAPKYGLAYYNRGTVAGQLKDYAASISDLTNSIRYEPNNDKAYMNRGLAFFYTKQHDQACTDWKKAAEMGNPEAVKAVDIYCNPSKPQENK